METFRSALLSELSTELDFSLAYQHQLDLLPESSCDDMACVESLRKRIQRSVTSPYSKDMSGPAVIYLPLGGASPSACPSVAESSVKGIMQMVFLWTIMSVFAAVSNVIANINNNQNNNNNNDNNINLNIISTQNTQISANTNNANTISIMLPPPIPIIGRGIKFEAEAKLKRFIAREERLRRKREIEEMTNSSLVISPQKQISLISIDILKYVMESDLVSNAMPFNENRDCLGKRLCLIALESHSNIHSLDFSALESSLWKIASLALMYVELTDRTQAFISFMENASEDTLNCQEIFWKCSRDDLDYILSN